jgi:hypothetical protein
MVRVGDAASLTEEAAIAMTHWPCHPFTSLMRANHQRPTKTYVLDFVLCRSAAYPPLSLALLHSHPHNPPLSPTTESLHKTFSTIRLDHA